MTSEARLAKGYLFKTDRSSRLGGIVLLSKDERVASLADLLDALPADTQNLDDESFHAASNVLVLSSDDLKELKTLQAFIVLLRDRIGTQGDADLERLIEIAMPELSHRSHPATLDQARRNAAFRTDFLREYDVLDASQVHELYGSTADNRAALASRWRGAGKIFGIDFTGRTVYPAFQFDDSGKPKPIVAKVLKILGQRGPWQIASWFTTPNGWLPNNQSPVEVMDDKPEDVVAAAKDVVERNLF